ncbi:hypothetical protein J5N97_022625 [Dioscorea zingiberensis]|uniref:Uncharacterized protein n=1 Tax=Dioscorea zingiberensis TaxID=325984 RepID=A0A9D5CAR9_9LILI|nr:hypothetical protein J5N97_022625 [Dioscorea zingiberensis]
MIVANNQQPPSIRHQPLVAARLVISSLFDPVCRRQHPGIKRSPCINFDINTAPASTPGSSVCDASANWRENRHDRASIRPTTSSYSSSALAKDDRRQSPSNLSVL